MNIFSFQRTFQSFYETYQKDVVLNSSILVNFVTRSALQKCELNYNSWPQFVSAIQTQPGKLNCPGCETFNCEPVLTSIADLKFVLIEFSPELMNVNVVELMEKLLLLENVDFELSTNRRMVTEMVDHQEKLDDQRKDN